MPHVTIRQKHLALLLSYTLLALCLTWPTVAGLSNRVPGDGIDDPAIVWNLWWVKYSLLNQPQNPLQTQFMFYPIGINLGFYTLTVLNGLTAIPWLLNLGVVAASNLHMWLTFILGAYGTFLLTYYLLRQPATTGRGEISARAARWGAFLAGIIFAFGSSRLFYVALGQFNIASTQWIPYTVLFFLKMHQAPQTLRWPIMTALFLTMQAWAELTHASFLIIFMALYWLYWFLSDPQRRVIGRAYLRGGLVLVGGFGLGISPFLAAILPDMQTEGDFFVVGGGFADIFSSDLLGFLIPTMHHPWLGHLITQTNIHTFDKGQHVYLGYTVLGLALVGFWLHRREGMSRFWLLAALVFGLLMLGPQVIVNGSQTGLQGPFTLLQRLPIFNGNRYPSRFSVMLLLTLAPLAAAGFARLSTRRSLHPVIPAILLSLLIIFENLALPLPQSSMHIPPLYRQIAQDPEGGAILDIPFGLRNGFRVTGAKTVGIMFGQFYQTEHQKPILHGNTSRNPAFKFQYFSEAPIISTLLQLESGYPLDLESATWQLRPPPAACRQNDAYRTTTPADPWETDPDMIAQVLRFLNLRTIVLRPEPATEFSHPQLVRPYLEALFPLNRVEAPSGEATGDAGGLSLYRVDLPPLPKTVDLLTASPLSNLYFGEGWGVRQPTQIVAHRKRGRLLVPLTGQAQRVTFTLWSPGPNNRMHLTLNGWQSETILLPTQPETHSIEIPAHAVKSGLNDIALHFSTRITADALTATGPPDITVISAGEEGGNLGLIYLNGVNVSPNQTGYNLARITPAGNLIDAANFNTHADPTAGQALADYIAAAPAEAIIAVAAKDEASGNINYCAAGNLSAEGVAALHAIGGQIDLRPQFRGSHALIGGQTFTLPVEAGSPLQRPVKISTGLGLVEPHIAAIFAAIRFEEVIQ